MLNFIQNLIGMTSTTTQNSEATLTDKQTSNSIEAKETVVAVESSKKTQFGTRVKYTQRKVTLPPESDIPKEMHNKITAINAALPSQEKTTESMHEELIRKAKDVRNRTHNHNQYYRGKGKDIYNLQGRLIKSIFEDDNGKKLPVEQRMEIMQELQAGKRKRAWR